MDEICEDVREARDRAMEQVESNAGTQFSQQAEEFILQVLLSSPEGLSGELLTDACKGAGIVPHDDRAFGPVYMRLARKGRIEKAGFVPRMKGNGTSGGNVWRLVQ